MDREERTSGHRIRQCSRQAGPVSQKPQRHAPGMGDRADTIGGYGQAGHEVRLTYKVPSTWSVLNRRQNKNPKRDSHFRASTRGRP